MEAKGLTPAQLEMLKMLSIDDSDDFAIEMKKVIGDYLQKKLDKELDRLWNEGILDQKKLDEIRKEDLHQTFPSI